MEFNDFQVGEYVTAIAWEPFGESVVVSTAAGAIVAFKARDAFQSPVTLKEASGQSIDVLSFSGDGQYLSAAGQGGGVWICELEHSLQVLEFSEGWIDQLVWHPKRLWLAIGVGKKVVIWNGETLRIEHTLEFIESSVLGLVWNCKGDRLTASGNRRAKTWQTQDWQRSPEVLELGSASGAIGWSPEEQYFAAGNFDRTVWVTDGASWSQSDPWRMRGFPVKITEIAWSHSCNAATQHPILATVSGEGVVIWNRAGDGWDGEVAIVHDGRVSAIAWHPKQLQLATAGLDGRIGLWEAGGVREIAARETGWSAIAWSPDGRRLVAGGIDGTVMLISL